MDDDQLEEIRRRYNERVKLNCDEYHAHSVMNPECHEGDEDALLILRLVHVIKRDRQLVSELNEAVRKPWHRW